MLKTNLAGGKSMVYYPAGVSAPQASRTKTKAIPKAGPKRRSKYNNVHEWVDGIEFDSKVEAKYYRHLKALKCDMRYHEQFVLEPAFTVAGHNYSARTYKPDFTIYSEGKLSSVIDVKGGKATLTTASRLRMVLFMARYHVPVVIATYDDKSHVFVEEIK